jgi:hypothetical protein
MCDGVSTKLRRAAVMNLVKLHAAVGLAPQFQQACGSSHRAFGPFASTLTIPITPDQGPK